MMSDGMARRMVGYRLQFFAEGQEGQEGQEEQAGQEGQEGQEKSGGGKALEDLQLELAKLKADNKKLEAERDREKRGKDEALSRLGDTTKKLRERQTTEEQEAEAKREADKQKDERIEELERKLDRMNAVKAYSGIMDDEKQIDLLIEAVCDRDHSSIANIIDNEKKKQKAADDKEWKKSRPPISTGGAVPMTREEIMKIQDQEERQKAIASNLALFK